MNAKEIIFINYSTDYCQLNICDLELSEATLGYTLEVWFQKWTSFFYILNIGYTMKEIGAN